MVGAKWMAYEQYGKGGLYGAPGRLAAGWPDDLLAVAEPRRLQQLSGVGHRGLRKHRHFQAVTVEQTAAIHTAFSLVSYYTQLTFDAATSSDTAATGIFRTS